MVDLIFGGIEGHVPHLFPLFKVGVWEGLRFVIVALPGLFSYLFFESESDQNLMNQGRK